jgi:hypothetical protein
MKINMIFVIIYLKNFSFDFLCHGVRLLGGYFINFSYIEYSIYLEIKKLIQLK